MANFKCNGTFAIRFYTTLDMFVRYFTESVDKTTYEYSAVFYVPPPILFKALTSSDDIQVRTYACHGLCIVCPAGPT